MKVYLFAHFIFKYVYEGQLLIKATFPGTIRWPLHTRLTLLCCCHEWTEILTVMVNTSTIINKTVNRSSPQLTRKISLHMVLKIQVLAWNRHTHVYYITIVSHNTFDSLSSVYISKSGSSKNRMHRLPSCHIL